MVLEHVPCRIVGEEPRARALESIPYAWSYDRLIGDAAQPALRSGWRRAKQWFPSAHTAAADIACGTGRFLPELLRVAEHVFAVDRSPAMLALAALRVVSERMTFLRQDMRRFALPMRCSLATCRFAAVNYLCTEADLLSTFRSVAAALVSGGSFIFDFVVHRPSNAPIKRWSERISVGHSHSDWHYVIDPRRGYSATRIEWVGQPGRTVHCELHLQRWYSRAVMGLVLKQAGFRIVDIMALPAGGPDNWMQIVAVKTGEPHCG